MSFQLKFVCTIILMSMISIKCEDLNEEPVELMTTQEPIDTADDLKANNFTDIFTTSIPVNCSMYSLCDTCGQNNCTWQTCSDTVDDHYDCSEALGKNCSLSTCEHDACKNGTDCIQCEKIKGCHWAQCSGAEDGPYCGKAAELCPPVSCNATVTTTTSHPNDNTTTVSPIDTTTVTPNDTTTTATPPNTTTFPPDTTTTLSPDTTTTPPPDTTTSSPDTTTSSPITTTSSPSPDTTTTSPPPDTTTSPDTTTTTSKPGPTPTPSPQSGGFSAGSFFGGITLTLALIAIGLGGYKFYKTRYDVNYRTL